MQARAPQRWHVSLPSEAGTPARPLALGGAMAGLCGRASLAVRLGCAAALMALEKAGLNLFVDFDRAQQARGIGAALRIGQHWGFRFVVSLVAAIVIFGWLRGGRELAEADAAARGAPLRLRWLGLHALLVLPLAPLSMMLYGATVYVPLPAVVALWLLLAGLGTVSLLVALAPWPLWRQAARALGPLWAYSAAAAAGSVAVMGASQKLWFVMSSLTFDAVYRLLYPFVAHLQTDSSALTIDTGRFAVAIDPVCSGLEGMGLMLAFCGALLLLFRREFIFPRALVLLPAGLILSFALNVVRIAALVLIGNAGYAAIAVYGFHSQAGWIAFNGAAAGMALVSLRSGWLTHTAEARAADVNPTALYLLPFLVLLAMEMASRAASGGGVEPLYWLPSAGVLLALAWAWPRLDQSVLGCSWRGPAAGVAAFALLSVARHFVGQSAAPAYLPVNSAPAPGALRLTVHLALAIGAMPIVEELAFRGYLLRRLARSDFQSVLPQAAGAWPLLLSSLIFGACYGPLWLPATLQGVLFGLVYMRTGRLGEAVAGHAVSNALTALAVLNGVGGHSP